MVKLTPIDDLAKQIFAAQEIPCRTIPPTVPELMLALADRKIGAFHQRSENARIVADETALFAAQRHVNGRVEVHDAGRQRCDVVRFADFSDAPERFFYK